MGDPKYHHPDWLYQKYWNEGLSTVEMGELCDVSGTTIQKWMAKHGIQTRPLDETRSKYKDADWIRGQYVDEGKSLHAIADELDVNHETIRYWLKKHGIDRRDAHDAAGQARIENGTHDKLLDEDWVREMYVERELSIHEITDKIDRTSNAVWRALNRFDIETRGRGHHGEEHPNWSGGCPDYYGKSWSEQREKAIERDGGKCRACGITREEHHECYGRDLNVHHIRPMREFEPREDAHQLDNLITLCIEDHHKWEGIPVVPDSGRD